MMLPWRLHKVRLRAGAFLTWLVVGFVLALLIVAVAPLAIGLHTYVVRSGSMTPTIRTGDLVITRAISPSEASIGEIVVFKDPEGSGRLYTHRVRAVHERNGRFWFVTRGDANTGFERWSVPADGKLGAVVFRIPALGFAIAPIASGPGRLLLIVLPALLLCVTGLRRIWAADEEAEQVSERRGERRRGRPRIAQPASQ